MNKLKCTDPELGILLHAYELNILPEENAERFEIHLLECEFCFEQLRDFERVANLLASDKEVKKLIRDSALEEQLHPEPLLKKLWRSIWPETSFVFKPALAYLLILLMILPTYYGLKRSTQKDYRPIVQAVSLSPFRSAGERALRVSVGGEASIDFVFEGAVAGQSYRLTIESKDGKVIFREDAFKTFDAYGQGRLLLPLSKIKPGDYRLTITDPRSKPPLNKREYSFRVEK